MLTSIKTKVTARTTQTMVQATPAPMEALKVPLEACQTIAARTTPAHTRDATSGKTRSCSNNSSLPLTAQSAKNTWLLKHKPKQGKSRVSIKYLRKAPLLCQPLWSWSTTDSLKYNRSQWLPTSQLSRAFLRQHSSRLQPSCPLSCSPRPLSPPCPHRILLLTTRWLILLRSCHAPAPTPCSISSSPQTSSILTLHLPGVVTAHFSPASPTRLTAHSQSPTNRLLNNSSSTCRPVSYLQVGTQRLVATRLISNSEHTSDTPISAFPHSAVSTSRTIPLTTHAHK